MSDIVVNGRYPHHGGRFDKNQITVDDFASKMGVTIRIDDANNLDFWLEVNISQNKLEQLLQKTKEAEE
jgi:CBS-domain-containing membrane protein